ncbi:MAG: HTH-type transcriptional repressor KstR2 [Planctomycetes bacterium ADurb.Bin401]|nr:MAG: HTH-type transcriptional repressor KstR2 [Planctomycetes bacterium ADurb.Bin401]
MENLSRKERDKIRHKKEILSEALNLFAEKGFHSVSMQDIAAGAGFGVGTLYNFFQSKEQLFEDLMNDCAEKIYQVLCPILVGDLPEEAKLRLFINSHKKLAEDNIKFIKLYVSEYGTLTIVNGRSQKSNDIKAAIHSNLLEIIQTGISKNVFRQVDSEIVVLSLMATLQAFIMESSKVYNELKVRNGLMQIEQFFFSMLLNVS